MAKAPSSGKPNVLLIFADDIGWFDVGAYNRGIMGAPTPNIDRIAKEGALLTDFYGQASCTAGRAAFITGQIPLRTGLTTVGMPGAPQGLQPEDPTIADLLKPLGYMTAQTGKNHLGDRNEFLPTVHGFDEFYGNLYHLNAEEEPEQADYPKDNALFEKLFKPRGVLECKATNTDDATVDERFGRVGKQTIKDHGPLNTKLMQTIEDDLLARSLNFIDRANDAGKPFLLWHNTTRMHVWTHLSERWEGKTKLGRYADGMQELDWVVGQLLKKLDDLGIADNTIIVFSTDNGAEKFTWPDGGTSPFRGEKGLGWEGGFRVPFLIRWPGGGITGNQVLNGIGSLEDVLPTVLAAAGVPDVKEKLLNGYDAGSKHFKVHLDGYNLLPYLKGEVDESPRHEFMYFGERNLFAIRYNNWKVHFETKDDWFGGAMLKTTVPRPVNLRNDPFEQHMEAPFYPNYAVAKLWTVLPIAAIVQKKMATFKDFPARQAPPDVDMDQFTRAVLKAAAEGIGN
ncbi:MULTISPECIES: arylsulfatase [unclassified Mesorhizobium]|uniref:arylsulfatase n=1 Tax=unclassified Mesorhizobium TaxID=325217 RepID=UPI000FD3497B|nr:MULTISPECIES: arylsulfatase [unclassified Mesorhizobium]RVB74420.1 arylsulfatase [Mesorhizobium sp. M6A.T.Cr.TU.014.01.1.1]RWP75049.1 MAG: arylsulfatase [Mesorhizobium sp.]RWP99161.1 MAG: arylsulfatase [Mesorhizobium sp.]RWQ04912.1 MAG: arylsulfatase [Mesorhizobium sp.]